MPTTFIQDFDAFDDSAYAIFDAAFEFVADGVKAKGRKAIFESAFDLVATGEHDANGEASFDGGFEFIANGFLDANILAPETAFESAFELIADGSLNREALAIFSSAFDLEATGENISPERFYWNVLFNTVPAAASGVYRSYEARVTVDGNVLGIGDIENLEYYESRSDASQRLTVSLGNVADRTLITRDSAIKFEIKDGSTWETIIDTGETASQNYSITIDRDSSAFTALSEGNTKLKYSPATNLVIYDSAVMTLSDADFEPIPDSSGNLIHTER